MARTFGGLAVAPEPTRIRGAHAEPERRSPALVVDELPAGWMTGAQREWDALLARSDADPVFSSWAWLSAMHDTLAGPARTRIVAARAGGDLVALVPLFRVRERAGLWASGWSIGHDPRAGGDYADGVCAAGCEAAAADAIARHLLARRDWARVEAVDVREGAFALAIAKRMGDAAHVEVLPGSTCPRIALDGGFDAWLGARLSRKHRYNVRRQLRLSEERGERLVLHETEADVARAFPRLVALHEARKRAQGVASTFAMHGRDAFHRCAAARLAASGRALVAELVREREVLAAAYCMRSTNSLYYFQTGASDAGIEAGAGTTLLLALARWAAARGLRHVDLMKGDEAYKSLYATERVVQQRIVVTPATPHGLAQRVIGRAVRAGRSALARRHGASRGEDGS